jgi:hypothetical protein
MVRVVIQANCLRGPKRTLTDAFIRAWTRDWQAHSEAVIQRVKEENPVAYCKGLINLLPKELSVDSTIEQTLNLAGLSATAELLERIRASGAHPRSKPKPH